MCSCSVLSGILLSATFAILLSLPAVHEWHNAIYGLTWNGTKIESSSDSSASISSDLPLTPPTRPAPLTRFLHTTEVDHAVAAARLFANDYRTDAYMDSIDYLLTHEWKTESQGVYNILQHSYMIPLDIRFEAIKRGLIEDDDIQYRLAAAVGVQFTNRKLFQQYPAWERYFRTIILGHASKHEEDDFLAARAFLSIKDLLHHPRDTRFVAVLAQGLNWRNVATWFIEELGGKERQFPKSALEHLLKQLVKAEQDRVRALGASEEDIENGVGRDEEASADASASLWTAYWSSLLLKLDIEKIVTQTGAALDDHVRLTTAKQFSKLNKYQELDIPNYAPLQQGFVDETGATHLKPMEQQQQQQQQPKTADNSRQVPEAVYTGQVEKMDL